MQIYIHICIYIGLRVNPSRSQANPPAGSPMGWPSYL